MVLKRKQNPKQPSSKNSKGDTKERDPKEKRWNATIGKEIWFGYTLDEWAAWGTDGAWSQTFDEQKDKEAWAWDSTAYWDQRSSAYALSKSQQPSGSSQAKPRRQTAKTTNSASKRKETKENEYDTADLKPKAKKGKTPMEIEDGEVAEKKKTPKNTTKQAATHWFGGQGKAWTRGQNQKPQHKAKAEGSGRTARREGSKTEKEKGNPCQLQPRNRSRVQHRQTWAVQGVACNMEREGCKRFWTLSSWSKMSQGTTSMKCLDLGWQHSARVAWMCTGAGQQLAWHAGQKRLMWATLAVPTTDGPRLIRMAAAFKAAEMLATCRH